MIRRPPRATQSRSSAASDVYKRQLLHPAITEEEHTAIEVEEDRRQRRPLARLRDEVAQQRVAFKEGHRLFGQQTDQGLADHLKTVVVGGPILSVQGLRAPQEEPAQQE